MGSPTSMGYDHDVGGQGCDHDDMIFAVAVVSSESERAGGRMVLTMLEGFEGSSMDLKVWSRNIVKIGPSRSRRKAVQGVCE